MRERYLPGTMTDPTDWPDGSGERTRADGICREQDGFRGDDAGDSPLAIVVVLDLEEMLVTARALVAYARCSERDEAERAVTITHRLLRLLSAGERDEHAPDCVAQHPYVGARAGSEADPITPSGDTRPGERAQLGIDPDIIGSFLLSRGWHMQCSLTAEPSFGRQSPGGDWHWLSTPEQLDRRSLRALLEDVARTEAVALAELSEALLSRLREQGRE